MKWPNRLQGLRVRKHGIVFGSNQVHSEICPAQVAIEGGGSSVELRRRRRRRPSAEPQPQSERVRLGPVMPKQRQCTRGRTKGSMQEKLPRRPAVRSVAYGRAIKGGFSVY